MRDFSRRLNLPRQPLPGQLIARAAAAAAAVVIAGCASTAGLSTHAMKADANALAAQKSLAPASLSPAAWPRTDWWKAFGDPQLDQLEDEALRGSPTLRVAQARAEKAAALTQGANAARYPRVDAEANVSRQRYAGNGLFPPPIGGATLTQPTLQATFAYDFDLWGKNRAAYESAFGQAKAAEVDAFAARLALSVNVAQAYVQLQRAYLQLDVARKSLQERGGVYDLTRRRFDEGLDSKLAVKQAESALPATRTRIAQLNESIGLLRNQLAALLGRGPDRGLSITRPAAKDLPQLAIPANVPAELLGRRPDLVAQRWRVEAASRDIAAAKAEFYPNVNLSAFIGLQRIGLPGFFGAANRMAGITPAVTLPIFDAGRLRANLRGVDADYDAAVELYNAALVDALRDVVDQLTSIRGVAEQQAQEAIALRTTREAYDLAVLRYREGVGNYLDVLTAESQLLAQQALDVDLRARNLTLSIDLIRALGGGFEPARREG
jgi:NodT family efflux transporter outer membrane factor (OMF) lipoprotein